MLRTASISLIALAICVSFIFPVRSDESNAHAVCMEPIKSADVELLLTKELGLDLLNRAQEATVERGVFDACKQVQQETDSIEFIRHTAVAAVLAGLQEDADTWLQLSAYSGSTDAMTLYGCRIVHSDTELSLQYLETAADRGNTAAMVVLALLYDNDSVVPANMNLSAEWLEKAIARDYAPAKYLLGSYLIFGRLSQRDDARAVALLHEAATAGHSGAADLLGSMLLHGIIVQKDPPVAILWLRQAAEAGRRTAMAELALALEEYPEVGVNEGEAAYWWSQAARFGVTRENYDPTAESVREAQNYFY